MLISGIQKLTLLDYPGKVACTVFTGGCNFRCPFCHNAALVIPGRLAPGTDSGEILEFLKKRVGILDGVAVTGGEPLLHAELEDFLKQVKELGYPVKLDTNGSFPEHLRRIVESGLADRVAMDIKNAPRLYPETTGIRDFDISPVSESKSFLMECGIEYEFRTTVVKGLHTQEGLLEAAEWIKGAKEYYLQQFKDSGDIISVNGLGAFNGEEMGHFKGIIEPLVPSVQLRGV